MCESYSANLMLPYVFSGRFTGLWKPQPNHCQKKRAFERVSHGGRHSAQTKHKLLLSCLSLVFLLARSVLHQCYLEK